MDAQPTAGPDYVPFDTNAKPVGPMDYLQEAEWHLGKAEGAQSPEEHIHLALVLAVMATAEELAEVRRAIERHP
jgi:hypothetical protein